MNEQQQQHAIARTHRITSSRIPVIATGNFKAWNSLAENMRNAKPAPIYSTRKTGVAPLDWGHQHEDWLCAQFWLRHPEYDVYDERWCWWHQPENKVFWEYCGTSPDRTLYQDVDGFPKRVSGVEAKNPYDPSIHRDYREVGELPEAYKPQVHWHMLCTDAPSWWFVSGDSRIEDPELNYFELQVFRDHEYENLLMHKVNRFLGGFLAGETFHPPTYDRKTYENIFG